MIKVRLLRRWAYHLDPYEPKPMFNQVDVLQAQNDSGEWEDVPLVIEQPKLTPAIKKAVLPADLHWRLKY